MIISKTYKVRSYKKKRCEQFQQNCLYENNMRQFLKKTLKVTLDIMILLMLQNLDILWIESGERLSLRAGTLNGLKHLRVDCVAITCRILLTYVLKICPCKLRNCKIGQRKSSDELQRFWLKLCKVEYQISRIPEWMRIEWLCTCLDGNDEGQQWEQCGWNWQVLICFGIIWRES